MKKIVERFDNALLFILSFVGLVISFMQINMNNLFALVGAIPYLTLGIALPFYVGYIRGAIEVRNVNERIRGWIYFIMGIGSYLAFASANWLTINYPEIQYWERETYLFLC